MIEDSLTDTVLFSGLLPNRYPDLWTRLAAILAAKAVSYRLLPGTRDVWTRDYMPVQVGPGEFVRFCYRPGYLRGHEHLITGPEVAEEIPEIRTLLDSEILLDGGNVVASGNTVLLTDRVYRENPTIPRAELRATLQRLLRCRVVIVPTEPGDVIGHADGQVRFLDAQSVVVNDYSELDPEYGQRLGRILQRAGLRVELIPYHPSEEEHDGIPSAVGNYINFLRVGELVVLPVYGLPEDEKARRRMERLLPEAELVPLRCEELARDGGVLNCIAWTIRTAEVPSSLPACDDRIIPSSADAQS